MKQRLFIALEIPADIRQSIYGMGSGLGRIRNVPVEQIHLTLKFIGDVDGGAAIDIKEALTTISHPPIACSLKGTGVFPPRGTPRVLWVGVEPQDPIRGLQRKIDNCLAAIDIERDKRKFSPHITIARFGDSGVKHLAEFLAGNALFTSPSFPVTSFTLFASRLTPKGAIHTRICQYPLLDKDAL